MSIFNNNTTTDDIKSIISSIEKENIEYQFFFVDKKTKDNIILLIKELIKKYNISHYEHDIIDILMELISNAIKAVYSNIIIIEELKEMYIEYKSKIESEEYIDDDDIMRKYYDILHDEEYKNKLKQIIKLEHNLLKDINNNIDITKDDKYNKILEYKRNNENKFIIRLIIKIENNQIYFIIINHAPLIEAKRIRIENKRRIFREYYTKGLVNNFFLEQLDNTESAGFGLALCDLKLHNNNLEPYEHLKIFDENNTTHSILIIPIQ